MFLGELVQADGVAVSCQFTTLIMNNAVEAGIEQHTRKILSHRSNLHIGFI